MFSRLLRDPASICGLLIIAFVFFAAFFAPVFAPSDPEPVNLSTRLLSPSDQFPLGTDSLGRCSLSRVLYGGRVTLKYALTILAAIIVIGVPLGLISGFKGGLVDSFIMRLSDSILAFPNLILALVLVGALGPGLFNVMLALALVSWVGYTRIIRGMVLSLKEKEYVSAAKVCGTSSATIVWRHILPNVLPPLAVLVTLDLGKLILAIATLSFLGLGAQPPTPEWGAMINEARPYLHTVPRLMLVPGIAIAFAVLGFNLLGDGLRDILDPKAFSGMVSDRKLFTWILPGGGKVGDK